MLKGRIMHKGFRMRYSGLFLLPLLLGAADPKKPPSGHVDAESVSIEATLLADKAAIIKAVGDDLGGSIMVIDLKLTPRGETPLQISRDDFTLKSDNDGQRSTPFAPSQIAGRGSLVVTSTGRGGGAYSENQRGPIWGGYPGTGGQPRRVGGDGAAIGNSSEAEAKAAITNGDRKEDSPLLATLKEKILPEKRTLDPVSGLLYFHLEGKHKPKHLELWYKSPAGKVTLRFTDAR